MGEVVKKGIEVRVFSQCFSLWTPSLEMDGTSIVRFRERRPAILIPTRLLHMHSSSIHVVFLSLVSSATTPSPLAAMSPSVLKVLASTRGPAP